MKECRHLEDGESAQRNMFPSVTVVAVGFLLVSVPGIHFPLTLAPRRLLPPPPPLLVHCLTLEKLLRGDEEAAALPVDGKLQAQGRQRLVQCRALKVDVHLVVLAKQVGAVEAHVALLLELGHAAQFVRKAAQPAEAVQLHNMLHQLRQVGIARLHNNTAARMESEQDECEVIPLEKRSGVGRVQMKQKRTLFFFLSFSFRLQLAQK